MSEAMIVDGWNGIDFCFFSDRYLRRLRNSWKDIAVRERPPAIVDVPDGIVPEEHWTGRGWASGVYDQEYQLVVASVPARGPKRERKVAEAKQEKLNRAMRDSRASYYLGCAGMHYGHFILETLCRAWAWREYGGDNVPVIQMRPQSMRNFAPAFFSLIPGLSDRIQVIQKATRFANVTVPAPAFVIAHEAHREFKRMCEQIAEKAMNHRLSRTQRPLYFSRTGLHAGYQRTLVGEERLERLLEREGFLIIHPERLSIVEQIALFNKHEWIVSPMGSACHTRLFSCGPTNLVLLAGEDINPNYLLCDFLCEGSSHYVNAYSSPSFGTGSHRGFAQPVLLEDESLLAGVKKFGLISAKAMLDGPPPDLNAYKQRWILAAEAQSIRLKNPALRQAAAELSASLSA